ncbi:MAG: hypothetical protein ACRDJN_25055, partial [Chloroflexota bacterium]
MAEPPSTPGTSPAADAVEARLRQEHTEEHNNWWRRTVLDTSVIISEHRHWLWLAARQDYYEGLWSPFIVGEVARIWTEKS